MFEDSYRNKMVPSQEVRLRIERFQQKLRADGLESALILYRPNYFYFSGTSQQSLLFVPCDSAPLLFVRRDLERARLESPIADILPLSSFREIPRIIEEHYGRSPSLLGLELDVLPARQYFRVQRAFPKAELKNVFASIMKCRMKKTPFELEQIRRAAAIGDEILEEGRALLRAGMREVDFGALLELEARKRGHEGIIRMRGLNVEGYSHHVLSGPNGSVDSEGEAPAGGQGLSPAFPMGAGMREIGRKEPILVDFPVCYNGYISDQSRIFCLGRLPEPFVQAYAACREVLALVQEKMRPGANCAEVFSSSKQLAQALGYEEGFLGLEKKKARFVGHGVGLEANELPIFGAKQDYLLEEDAALAIEPKIVLPGKGIVGLENMYVTTAKGCDKLTNISEEIIEV